MPGLRTLGKVVSAIDKGLQAVRPRADMPVLVGQVGGFADQRDIDAATQVAGQTRAFSTGLSNAGSSPTIKMASAASIPVTPELKIYPARTDGQLGHPGGNRYWRNRGGHQVLQGGHGFTVNHVASDTRSSRRDAVGFGRWRPKASSQLAGRSLPSSRM